MNVGPQLTGQYPGIKHAATAHPNTATVTPTNNKPYATGFSNHCNSPRDSRAAVRSNQSASRRSLPVSLLVSTPRSPLPGRYARSSSSPALFLASKSVNIRADADVNVFPSPWQQITESSCRQRRGPLPVVSCVLALVGAASSVPVQGLWSDAGTKASPCQAISDKTSARVMATMAGRRAVMTFMLFPTITLPRAKARARRGKGRVSCSRCTFSRQSGGSSNIR